MAEHAREEVDVNRVVRMMLVHDIVEIDVGDTFLYDREGQAARVERESAAARRIFGLLPADQADELRELWEEFEAKQTPEAAFAGALDRLMPLLHNYHTQGRAWQEHDVCLEQVLTMNAGIEAGSAALWEFARNLIEDAVRRGFLRRGPEPGGL